MAVKLNERTGITCGMRKDGSRCVLWSDDSFEWFSASDFAKVFGN
jgi:hypothetical protein